MKTINISVSKEMQIKTTMGYHYTPTGYHQKDNKKFGGAVGELDPHALLLVLKDGAAILENSTAVSSKTKHKRIIPGCLFNRNENIRPHKDLYMNAHSSIVHGGQKTQNNPNVQLVNG